MPEQLTILGAKVYVYKRPNRRRSAELRKQ